MTNLIALPPSLSTLRDRLSVMDRVRAQPGQAALSLGLGALDAALPGGGLVRGGVHELITAPGDAAAHGFAASLLSRLPDTQGPILWCRLSAPADPLSLADMPYGPGLAGMGLDPSRLILVRPGCLDDALWVLEEALRCRNLAAVVGDGVQPSPVAGRRLQLAAEQGGALGLMILPPLARPPPSVALTRWQVTALPAATIGDEGEQPCWRISLLRARGGGSNMGNGRWEVMWDDTAFRLDLVQPLADGPMATTQ